MSPEIVAALVGGVAGLLTGVVASLAAPWVHWAIERRRRSFEHKTTLIKDIRALIQSAVAVEDVMKSPLWAFIKSQLTEEDALTARDFATLTPLPLRYVSHVYGSLPATHSLSRFILCTLAMAGSCFRSSARKRRMVLAAFNPCGCLCNSRSQRQPPLVCIPAELS